jgi:hypothetical protein
LGAKRYYSDDYVVSVPVFPLAALWKLSSPAEQLTQLQRVFDLAADQERETPLYLNKARLSLVTICLLVCYSKLILIGYVNTSILHTIRRRKANWIGHIAQELPYKTHY